MHDLPIPRMIHSPGTGKQLDMTGIIVVDHCGVIQALKEHQHLP
jgi:hypothetical protein